MLQYIISEYQLYLVRGEKMLKLINVSKNYKKKVILNNANLCVESGELVHIEGDNGSGKTTLLKLIARLIKPNSGEIILDDKKLNLGVLIENPKFIENETAKFNLEFLFNLKNRYSEDKVKELFNYFNLDYNNKDAVKKYSLGMRQKLGIIQAMMESQNFILLDEPFRGLDYESEVKLSKLIMKLNQEGTTFIICSHGEVRNLTGIRKIVLENGILNDKD